MFSLITSGSVHAPGGRTPNSFFRVGGAVKNKILAIAAAGVMAWATTSQAVTIFDIASTGSVCTYSASSGCANQSGLSFAGTMTIDVNPAGPAGADHFTDGSTYDQDYESWVARCQE
jgi:hypothetical protein